MNASGQNVSNRFPISAWETGNLRLTLFPSPTAQIVEQTWWIELFEQDPEIRNLRPKAGEQHEEDRFEEGKLTLVVRPGRIDWRFSVDDKERSVGELPTVGSFLESLDKFTELMLRWLKLETCPSAERLAFGAVLLKPVENRQEGYRQISAYLPYDLDPEGSSDFSYQINRPRDSSSGIAGLRINRLSKWSVATTRWVNSRLFLGLASATHFPGAQIYACRLELDVNTVPDLKDELSQEGLPRVFKELVDLGKEIAREGDIA